MVYNWHWSHSDVLSSYGNFECRLTCGADGTCGVFYMCGIFLPLFDVKIHIGFTDAKMG